MARKNSVNFDLRGDKELKRLLEKLPLKAQKKGMRRALTLAATPIAKAAKANAPRDTGTLKRSITKKVKTYSSGKTVAVIGPDRGVTNKAGAKLGSGKETKVKKTPTKRPANYAHLVEFGHAGPHPAAANAFMKKAYTANEGKAIQVSKQILKETLLAEAAKLAAKAKKT